MKIDAKAPEGNVYNIMGLVWNLLSAVGRKNDWPDVERRMKSGNYDNACDVAEEVTYGSIKVINRDKEARP